MLPKWCYNCISFYERKQRYGLWIWGKLGSSYLFLAFLVAQLIKESACNAETQFQSLGQEDPLEKEMATHSSILAWRILWTEEPGRLQCMGCQRVRHNWATSAWAGVFRSWPNSPLLPASVPFITWLWNSSRKGQVISWPPDFGLSRMTFLVQHKVKVAQSCPTLCNPTAYPVHGILQAIIQEWAALPFSRGSPPPRDGTQVSHTAGGHFASWAQGSPGPAEWGTDANVPASRLQDAKWGWFFSGSCQPCVTCRWEEGERRVRRLGHGHSMRSQGAGWARGPQQTSGDLQLPTRLHQGGWEPLTADVVC